MISGEEEESRDGEDDMSQKDNKEENEGEDYFEDDLVRPQCLS